MKFLSMVIRLWMGETSLPNEIESLLFSTEAGIVMAFSPEVKDIPSPIDFSSSYCEMSVYIFSRTLKEALRVAFTEQN